VAALRAEGLPAALPKLSDRANAGHHDAVALIGLVTAWVVATVIVGLITNGR
jgi:hypothetical protein